MKTTSLWLPLSIGLRPRLNDLDLRATAFFLNDIGNVNPSNTMTPVYGQWPSENVFLA